MMNGFANHLEIGRTLSATNRIVRATIGAVALLAILMDSRMNEVWLFVLAMTGFYESLTAFIGVDLIRSLFEGAGPVEAAPPSAARPDASAAVGKDPQRMYKKVA